MKHVPLRLCIVCREQKQKSELLRIVRTSDGEITFDPSGKLPGRGAYICADGDCVEKAAKKHALDRVYKTHVSDEAYAKLIKDHGEINAKRSER